MECEEGGEGPHEGLAEAPAAVEEPVEEEELPVEVGEVPVAEGAARRSREARGKGSGERTTTRSWTSWMA